MKRKTLWKKVVLFVIAMLAFNATARTFKPAGNIDIRSGIHGVTATFNVKGRCLGVKNHPGLISRADSTNPFEDIVLGMDTIYFNQLPMIKGVENTLTVVIQNQGKTNFEGVLYLSFQYRTTPDSWWMEPLNNGNSIKIAAGETVEATLSSTFSDLPDSELGAVNFVLGMYDSAADWIWFVTGTYSGWYVSIWNKSLPSVDGMKFHNDPIIKGDLMNNVSISLVNAGSEDFYSELEFVMVLMEDNKFTETKIVKNLGKVKILANKKRTCNIKLENLEVPDGLYYAFINMPAFELDNYSDGILQSTDGITEYFYPIEIRSPYKLELTSIVTNPNPLYTGVETAVTFTVNNTGGKYTGRLGLDFRRYTTENSWTSRRLMVSEDVTIEKESVNTFEVRSSGFDAGDYVVVLTDNKFDLDKENKPNITVKELFNIDGTEYCIINDNSVLLASGKDFTRPEIPSSVDIDDKTYIVTAIGNKAFNGENLTSITIPSTITEIGDSAFINCHALSSVIINNPLQRRNAETVKIFGKGVFYGCDKLSVIKCFDFIPPICEDKIFSEMTYSDATLIVPDGAKEIYSTATGWSDFLNIVESSAGVDFITTDDNKTEVIYDIYGRRLPSIRPGMNIVNGKKVFVRE